MNEIVRNTVCRDPLVQLHIFFINKLLIIQHKIYALK